MKGHWDKRRLDEVCTKITDGSHNPPKGISHSDFIMISSQNVFNDNIVFDDVRFLTADDFISEDKRTAVRVGDVLLTIVGTIGRCAVFTGDKKITLQRSVAVLHPKSFLAPRFLMYCLIGKNRTLTGEAHGIAQKGIYLKQLSSISIPIPSLPEQERIVAELDLLQGVIDKQKSQLKELDTLAQSIFYDMFGNPAENEKGWEIKPMGDLFEIGSSKRVFESQWTDSGVPFYRAREVVRLSKNEPIESPIFISEELYQEYANKYGVPSEGDIMITAVGTLGVCYIVKSGDRFYFKDGNILWFKSKKLCDSQFIKDEYATDFVRQQIQGNANAAVVGTYTIMNAKKTKVLVPPLSLQLEYTHKIQAIEQQKTKINQSIAETQKLFDYTMDKYFG